LFLLTEVTKNTSVWSHVSLRVSLRCFEHYVNLNKHYSQLLRSQHWVQLLGIQPRLQGLSLQSRDLLATCFLPLYLLVKARKEKYGHFTLETFYPLSTTVPRYATIVYLQKPNLLRPRSRGWKRVGFCKSSMPFQTT